MTTALANHQPALPVPQRIGQGTAVEQTRAIAEVQAAVVVAQQAPRDIDRAQRDMYRSCAQKSLAEKAFYRFPRGRETVSGPSVQLARELARCFGNVQYGVTELRRDDVYGQSEMQAWAWDLETNTRSSTTFIVPHRRDKRGGSEVLTDMRDIYESNANNGARRLREMIFAILPGWYTEDAITACYETLAGDAGDLPTRIQQCVEAFGKLGVRQPQLEQKAGGPVAKWTPYDLAQMQVIYRSLVRGETSKEDEFGASPERVTASEITGQRQEPAGPEKPAQRRRGRAAPPDASPAEPQSRAADAPTPPAPAAGEAPMPPLPGEEDSGPALSGQPAGPAATPEPDETDYDSPRTVTTPQITAIWTVLSTVFKFGSDEKDQARAVCAHIVGHDLASTKDMSKNEAKTVLDTLANWREVAEQNGTAPREFLTELMGTATDTPEGDPR